MHYDLLVRGPLCIDWNIWISWSHCSLVNPSLLTSVDTELAATPLLKELSSICLAISLLEFIPKLFSSLRGDHTFSNISAKRIQQPDNHYVIGSLPLCLLG
uniref:Uncharacterized protein isoform X1 n=1 Tax=Nicotiana tabacum TaxID=4097 RepID=A0A1S3ZM19_TOBAC|nr:PREDICTED: uncharacterized protein LOC107788259 isoform X1 [Nicotiana tabacum]